ncbi:HNH endonuclease [Brevundimonas aveniformis]|uniref:HNH endonuclease n=1 Tax=Brevundimonas aveniformis TaxID=370977 RepID=UPI000427CCFE|nr:HNH endonuclease signature motif containing protein [Brevundimonas aveniformis]
MPGGNILIRRSPEMYLVAYALARAGADGTPPSWLGVGSWNEAYDLFYLVLGNGRSQSTFRNSLKAARDTFDGHFENGRQGWRQSSKIERPPAPNKRAAETMETWQSRSEAELREAVLTLIAESVADAGATPEADVPTEDLAEADARLKVLAEVTRRQGQKQFRGELMKAYGAACAISGCDVREVLEAAHIRPYLGPHSNDVTNGLLLRADLHTLFDLRLIKINADTLTVQVSDELKQSPYGEFHGKPMRLPDDPAQRPSKTALAAIMLS